MVDYSFQELTGSLVVSESSIVYRKNSSSSVKFKIGYDGVISLDQTAEYLDSNSVVLLEGKIKVCKELVKDVNSDKRIYEITIFDYGYNLIDGNLNEVYRSETAEDILQDIVENNGLTFVNQLSSASGLTIDKTYNDVKPIEAVNSLCEALGASWIVKGTNFYLFRSGETLSSEEIFDWTNTGWKDDTDKKATKVIVIGKIINQRTSETLTGTGTIFYTTYKPNDVKIAGLTQTTSTIAGDYTVDIINKKITFNSPKTDPVVEYSYESQIRREIGFGDIVKILRKTYIETPQEAKELGKKYLALYEDGISSTTFQNVDVVDLDVTKFRCGDRIKVTETQNPARNGEYIISQVTKKYPRMIEIIVGEDETSIYDWQVESKDRVKQLEDKNNNSEFSQLDMPLFGKTRVKISGELKSFYAVIDDGDVLWASDTPLDSGADLIYNMNDGTITGATYTTGIVGDYALDFSNLTSDRVTISNLISIFQQTGNYSVSCWVYLDNTGTNRNVWNFNGGGSNRHNLNINGSSIGFQIYNGSEYTGVKGTYPGIGAWHHVVCINNGGNVSLYVDNVQLVVSGNEYAVSNTGDVLVIGYPNSTTNGSGSLDGKVDEFMVFNKSLNFTEISTLYAKGLVTDGLIAKYSFEEGSGSSAKVNCPLAYNTEDLPAKNFIDYLA